MARHVLVVRLDSLGDMLAAGPAVRAVAAGSDRVTVLAGPAGAAAARMLPGADDVIVWACPWIVSPPPQVSADDVSALIERVQSIHVDEAVVLTSFHQSSLPTALLLRLAGVPKVTAVSEDYPGSLLDVRVPDAGDVPEPLRMLATAEGAGFALPAGDTGALAVRRPFPEYDAASAWPPGSPYLVAHPGTSAPARAYPPELWPLAIERLVDDGWNVVMTGGPDDVSLCREIVMATAAPSVPHVIDLADRLDLPELAAVLDAACVTVAGNTGPAHLSAAVGTPVVSLFAPVVPAARWAPFGVPVELLGDQGADCRDTRWTRCRTGGHPCLSTVTAADIVLAARRLARDELGISDARSHEIDLGERMGAR